MNTHGLKDTQLAMLGYDIPEIVKNGRKVGVMPNPSHLLEKLGMIRVSLSVWAGTLGAIAQLPIEEWRRLGCKPLVAPYHDVAVETLRRQCREQLEEEAARTRRYLASQMKKAEAMFAEAEMLKSTKMTKEARSRLVGVKREAQRRIAAAQAQALAFDLTADMNDLWQLTVDSLEAFIAAGNVLREATAKPGDTPQQTFMACVAADEVQRDIDAMEEAEAGIGAVTDIDNLLDEI